MTPPLDLRGDCSVCGGPRFQNGRAHAEWCDQIARWLEDENSEDVA